MLTRGQGRNLGGRVTLAGNRAPSKPLWEGGLLKGKHCSPRVSVPSQTSSAACFPTFPEADPDRLARL